MTQADLKKISKLLAQSKKTKSDLAKLRDKLRDQVSDLKDLLENLDEGLDDFNSAHDEMVRAVDKMSELI